MSQELITKLKAKKSIPTLDNIGLNGLLLTILEFATKINGGSAEIRTLGGSPLAGFQDRCFQPLSHTSAMAVNIKGDGLICK